MKNEFYEFPVMNLFYMRKRIPHCVDSVVTAKWHFGSIGTCCISKGVPICTCKSVLVSVPISKASAKPIFVVFYWLILN